MFASLHNFFARFERPISSFSLVGGFVFDALTLKRVDTLWENVWVVVHLLIVATCILLINRMDTTGDSEHDLSKSLFWMVNVLQFFFGGLLSTYLVFYFRSSALSVSWPFILILTLAFIANERFKRHYVRVGFQVSLFFLSLFSYTIIETPVVLHEMGAQIFIVSGAVALSIMFVFLYLLRLTSLRKFSQSSSVVFGGILGTFLVVNLLYFTNLIPPVPLALKDAGIYHSIVRDDYGNYLVTAEDSDPWTDAFTLYDVVHQGPSNPIYAYSAVFSPTAFNFTVIHDWQQYDEATHTWISRSQAELPVIGGRDGGYRTYSHQMDVAEGKWRVNVETHTGAVIGRLYFMVVKTPAEPTVHTEIKSK
ncbi:MAG: hypothetical protein RLZZ347_99 [Candidatus Parcubacteria bacterium]|jgi:hypothetical protein